MSAAVTYYHGGPRGLRGFIFPPAKTGARCASDYGAGNVHDRNRVYVTTDKRAALVYAAMSPGGRGVVYRVEPFGTLEPDPDCSAVGLSFACRSARIRGVTKYSAKLLRQVRRAVFPGELP